tara:strand:- start:1142 stop:2509 length:1368 start_codon:yes stop_codon:yes gene_type:complete
MNISRLAFTNILSKPSTTLLSLLLMSLGVGIISILLILNNHIEKQLDNNLRSIDMVVGAKGSPLQLILSSVYHLDKPTGNISYKEAKSLNKNVLVDFTIPLSYGDTYKGYRIVGTNEKYFDLYNLELSQGKKWSRSMQAVLGSSVASNKNLKVGDKFFGTHGFDDHGHIHDNHAYVVVGILKQSYSVADNLILTNLKSVWQVHEEHDDCEDDHSHDHSNHDHSHDDHSHDHSDHDNSHDHHSHNHGDHNHSHDHHSHDHSNHDHNHDNHSYDDANKMITAMLVKFKSPVGLVQIPRKINEETNMQAAIPLFEINRLTSLIGFGINTINIIALIIMLVSGISIFITLFNSLKKRRYELALMRVHGATRIQLIKLIFLEGLSLSILGTFFGLLISRFSLVIISSFTNQNQSFTNIDLSMINSELLLLIAALIIGFIASLIPALSVYRINIPKILSNE